MHNLTRKQEAIALRKRGYSYSIIFQKTGVPKATLSDWLGGIPYLPNDEVLARIGKARARAGARHAEKKHASLSLAAQEAKKQLGSISGRDLLLFGLGLYLGEGAKTTSAVRIVNSDPTIIALAVAWFEALGVRPEQFGPRLHLYPDTDVAKSVSYWAKVVGVPPVQFQKSYIDVRTDKKAKKQGKLPHGTLHLTVRSGGKKEYGVFFFRKIQAMNAQVLRSVCGRGLPV